jgi:hypothetical protein
MNNLVNGLTCEQKKDLDLFPYQSIFLLQKGVIRRIIRDTLRGGGVDEVSPKLFYLLKHHF